METTVGQTTIRSHRGDLTTMEVDAIVNAANERLAHAGGLAGAIARAGGDAIQRESDAWVLEHGPLHPGLAAVTGPGNLPCRAIVHVAGPVHRPGRDNEGLLRAAVQAALAGAVGSGARTVAMPAISAGVFGYPLDEAAAVIADETLRWAAEHTHALSLILLVGFDDDAERAFAAGIEAAAARAAADGAAPGDEG
ncbi:MAG: macro domain-containing protein [Actinobacteria bacterium]|nr:macro domain-containing protein [Actinomycetota bacterium]